jgi:hypothetical protein
MANLVGTDFARNYVKAVETSQMGTRQLAFFQVDMNTDVETNYTNSNSLYAQAIRGLQTVVELYAIGKPNGSNFTVIVAADTAPYDSGDVPGDGNRNSILEDAVDAATGESSRIFDGLLNGWNIENDC